MADVQTVQGPRLNKGDKGNKPEPKDAPKPEAPAVHPLSKLLGDVQFSVVKNAKEYPDERNKGQFTRKLAFATFTIGDLLKIQGTVYSRTGTDDGGKWQELSFTLGKGISSADDKAELLYQSYKEQIIGQYEEWATALKANAKRDGDTQTSNKGGRLVRRGDQIF